MTQATRATTTPSEKDPQKIWVMYSFLRRDHAEQLCEYLRSCGHNARAMAVEQGLRDVAWDRLEDGVEQLRRFFAQHAPTRLFPAFEELSSSPPRVVIVDNARTLRAFDRLRTWLQADFKIVLWVNDLESRAMEKIGARIDAVIAPTTIQIEQILEQSHAENALCVGPLAPPLLRDRDDARARARKAMRVDDECVVMIDASHMRAQDIPLWIGEIARQPDAQRSYRWLFYYGEHEENAEAMRHAAKTYGFAAWMFGQNTPVDQVLPGIDVLLTPNQSSCRDLAAWLPIHILSIFTPPSEAPTHPLVKLRRARALEGYHDILSSLRDAVQSERSPSIATAAALKNADDAKAIFGCIESFLQKLGAPSAHETKNILEEHGDDRDALAFEELVGATDARTSDATIKALSSSELREELTRIFKQLRRLEDEHTRAVEARDLWMERLQDAEEANEGDLIAYAKDQAQENLRLVATLQQQIVSVQDLRDRLRGQAKNDQDTRQSSERSSDHTAANYEARFEQLAQERRLRALRKRANLEDP